MSAAVHNPGRVRHLSPPMGVNMGNRYYDFAGPEHFWIIRRFAVARRLAGDLLHPGATACEIGCGNGVLQWQLEQAAGMTVDGMDLNLPGLESSIAARGEVYHYNVFDRRPEFAGKYDLLFLFDVLEHLDDDLGFLQACLFHLKPGGHIVINVPARMELFSRYDIQAGHSRRYDIDGLLKVCQAAGLSERALTYWGLPFYPLLRIRKWRLRNVQDMAELCEKGFAPPGALANRLLGAISGFEPIPQRWTGTSVQGVFRKEPAA